MMGMVEQMMKDPKMQEMMYPYLPEGMRNPETFDWIMSNPEMRGQMEEMLKNGMPGGGMNPEMMNAMGNMNDADFKKQFDQVGMSPDEVLKKIMDDPQLAAAFQNPRVQQAMMDCSANPMNISKYTGDKEVMDAMIKMSQMFPNQMGTPPGV
uniref:Protein TIC 40, chloroplastic n=1 Tax=Chloropicon laureae TaxID=464258 RepID=A0A7S2Z5P0_9CHLO